MTFMAHYYDSNNLNGVQEYIYWKYYKPSIWRVIHNILTDMVENDKKES